MDYTLSEWIEQAGEESLAHAACRCQAEESGTSEQMVREAMLRNLLDMESAVKEGLKPDLRSVSGLTGGQASRLYTRFAKGDSLSGGLLGRAITYALATAECNACMGRIVAAPTAGSCGILPGLLLSYKEENNTSQEALVDALLVASAIGISIATQATISGAEGGCQAECGAAAAMAAGALCALEGGNNEMCMHAAAFALMNMLGLVCDPVEGLVEVPCVFRNVGACGIAVTAAVIVLSGIRCPLEPDEVILAMKDVGEALPLALRETGDGGCAACRTVHRL